MPEGDTIFRTARTLHRALGGQAVARFETQLPGLAVVDRRRAIVGRIVEQVGARGKHLLITFSGGLVLRTHMRMHGSWHIYRPGERWRAPARDARIVIGTAVWVAVAFAVNDAELLTADELILHPRLSTLGPDLLSNDPDIDDARARIRSSGSRHIAEALLAQRAVAGLGNVYKSELLFMAGLHPFTAVADVPDETLNALLRRGRDLLRLNVAETSIAATRTRARRTTGSLNPEASLWVYGRTGRPCRRCGTAIASQNETDGRRTYWCPTCQPAHRRSAPVSN